MSKVVIQTELFDSHGSSVHHPVGDMARFTQKKSGYVEGFLSVIIDGKEMFGPECWDDVRMLWSFLSNMLDNCLEGGSAETSLAERGVPIRIQAIRGRPGQLLLSVGNPDDDYYGVPATRATVAASDLYPAFARAYLDTFENFRRINIPRNGGVVPDEQQRLMQSWIDEPRDYWLRTFPG